MDFVFINELRLQAWVGVYPHESVGTQTIEFDIEIALPGEAVFATGRVGDTIDYGTVVQHIRDLLAAERFGLVEILADRVARMILDDFSAPWTRVCVAKLGALKGAKRVGACVERTRASP